MARLSQITETYDRMSTSAGSSVSESSCSPPQVRAETRGSSDLQAAAYPMSPTVSSTTSDGGSSEGRSAEFPFSRSLNKDDISEERKAAMKSAHVSNEFVRLSETLHYMHPEDIKNTIMKRVMKKDSKALIALSILFPRSRFPPVEHAHCARCHKEFNPLLNTQCCVPHSNSQVVKLGQDSQGATFMCKACRCQFRLIKMFFYDERVSSYMSGSCFNGKHTTNAMEVEFNGSVLTCEERGCVELYV